MRLIPFLAGFVGLFLATASSAQEFQASVYGGWQTAPHSSTSGQHPLTGSFQHAIGWNGKSFAAPPYYGVRGTWWRENDSGWGVELTDAKV